MPWCPKCKYEYREGITKCADCDVELVDELPIEEPEEMKEVPNELLEEIDEEMKEKLEAGLEADDVDGINIVKSNIYVKKADKYNDFKFSGYSFLSFAILGFAFILLNVVGILNVLTTFSIIVMTVLFAVFTIIGIHSLVVASRMKGSIGEEAATLDKIKEWINDTFSDEYFETVELDDEADENRYFTYSVQMNQDIQAAFPDTDVSLLDELTDEFLNQYLDKKGH